MVSPFSTAEIVLAVLEYPERHQGGADSHRTLSDLSGITTQLQDKSLSYASDLLFTQLCFLQWNANFPEFHRVNLLVGNT